jgi:hypothetical protein
MRVTLRDATLSDVHEIMQDLSDISRHELTKVFGSTWKALKDVRTFLANGKAEVALAEDGKPLLVFGHMPHAKLAPDRVTWFIASKRYFELGPHAVLRTRRRLQQIRRDWPMRFYCYTLSPHPDVHRWLTLLGFTAQPAYGQLADGSFTFTMDPTPKAKRDDAPLRA